MDITQVQTFLAVVQTGSFLGASDVVHVTQSTVSVRIRSLEDELRVHLFSRGKNGAVLTKAGRKFLKTATAMTQLWEQARLDVGLADEHPTVLRVGGQVSLWDGYLTHWLSWMYGNAPGIALRAHMADPLLLIDQLVEGALDIAIIYRPQHRPGFQAEQIFIEEIVLVSSEAGACNLPGEQGGGDYILTYWGPEFQKDHALNFPNIRSPRLSIDLGTMGVNILLQTPSSGYFPLRVVAPHIASGRLKIVADAPRFFYPAYAILPDIMDDDTRSLVVGGLQQVAASLAL